MKEVECAGRKVLALVDTCSDVTVVSEVFADKLRLPTERWDGSGLVFVTGGCVKPLRALDIRVLVDERSYHTRAVIVKTGRFEILIGNDILKQTKRLIVDYEKKTTTVEHRKQNSKDNRVKLAATVNIPARTTMRVKVVHHGDGSGSRKINLLEPTPGLLGKKGIGIGRILAEGPISEVYLTNFEKLPQRVEANCCLAQAEPVKLVKAVTLAKSDITVDDLLKRVNCELTEQEKLDLVEILVEESDCFARDGEALGQSSVFQHEIPTNSDRPIHVRPYASAWKERQLVEDQVREMLKQNVIEPSTSPWSAPVVLVKKKDGKWRFCVDYRKLNAVTTKTIYPLPRIEESLTRLKGSCYFSSIDLQSGYWQLSVRPEDQEKTAFTTADGHYQFRAMPFGLSGSAHTFQRAMDVILAGLKWTACLVYLDDVVVYGKDMQQHNERLREVLRCLRSAGMKIKLSKCHFGATSLHILGHVVSEKGIAADPDKLRAVECFPVPRNVKEVQSFLGLCSYFRKFVPQFSWIARPLSMLLKKKQKWQWQAEQKESFDSLKKQLMTPPVLAHPDPAKPMEIHPDASAYGIGALLVQKDGEVERPLAYASRILCRSEENYSITEKECLALVWAVKKFRPFIWGQPIRVVTDHHALCWLFTKKDLAGRLARWSLQLQDYDLEVTHRSGRKHQDADCLSRSPVDAPTEELGDERHIFLISEEQMDWALQQRKDPKWSGIIEKLRKGEDPTIQRTYILCDEKLYKKTFVNNGNFYRLCVPLDSREKVLSACHSSETAGHLGVLKTRERVLSRYFWSSVREDVARYVRTCRQCQTRKHRFPHVRTPRQCVRVIGPFETVGVDILGPFPRSIDGNKFVILAVDYLTKWTMTRAVPKANADEVVRFFLEKIVYLHGAPHRIITDHGKCFVAKTVDVALQKLRIKHNLASVGWPRGNALAERVIRTITDMIAMFVSPTQEDWDAILPALTFAYNSSQQQSTGKTPFFLLYGREPRLPIDTVTGAEPQSLREPEEESEQYAHKMEELQEKVKQRISLRQNKMRSEESDMSLEFRVGDKVLLYHPKRQKGRAEKLVHRYVGPYEVTRIISPVNCEVRECDGKKRRTVIAHVEKMKPFFDPQEKVATSSDTVKEEQSIPYDLRSRVKKQL